MPQIVRTLTSTLAFAAVVAILGAIAAPSLASTGLPRAMDQRTFRIDVKGVQTTHWTLNKPSTGPCDPAQTGHGSERVVFRTARPLTDNVKRYGTSYVIYGNPFELGRDDFTTQATVTRFGHIDSAQVAAGCGIGTGDGPVAPDCGTKRVTLDLQLGYMNEPRHGFTLTAGDLGPAIDPFHNCNWVGGITSFPKLLEQRGKHPILGAIPVSDLFNRSFGQQIVVARGSQRVGIGGLRAVTSIRWDVRLTAAHR